MPSTGRPRKNNQPEETKQPARPTQRGVLKQQPKDGASKEQKPKKLKEEIKTAGKPPVQSSGREEMIAPLKNDPGSKNDSLPRQKVRTSAAGDKSTTSEEEATKTQTKATTHIKDSPKNTRGRRSRRTTSDVEPAEERGSPPTDETADNSPKTTTEKKTGGKVKQSVTVAEKTKSDSRGQTAQCHEGRAKPETPSEPRTSPVKKEVLPDQTQLPPRFAEVLAETEPKANQEPPKGRVAKGKRGLDFVLSKTLEEERIRKCERGEAARVVNNVVNEILKHLKEKSESFKGAEPLKTGSYYENLKVSNPDEFDIMISVPVDRLNVRPFGNTGAFYSASLKRANSPLKKFQLEENDILSAYQILNEFREEVKKSIKGFTEWKVQRKKVGCPAVTLTTETPFPISLDVVLSLKVKSSWPDVTKDGFQVESWLGAKVKQSYKHQPYYLVPKYAGRGTETHEGVFARDTWRLSFSHIEKAIMVNHGSEKTCCEARGKRCCRKDCLKLLKRLLHLLKEKDATLAGFCSYHAKTTLLHSCCDRNRDSDWRVAERGKCFQQLVNDFVGYLESGELFNFFIPTQNLLSDIGQRKCTNLARQIRKEQDEDFPLFQ